VATLERQRLYVAAKSQLQWLGWQHPEALGLARRAGHFLENLLGGGFGKIGRRSTVCSRLCSRGADTFGRSALFGTIDGRFGGEGR
jgi:hypothetical protein